LKFSSIWLNNRDQGTYGDHDGSRYLSSHEETLVKYCFEQYKIFGTNYAISIPSEIDEEISGMYEISSLSMIDSSSQAFPLQIDYPTPSYPPSYPIQSYQIQSYPPVYQIPVYPIINCQNPNCQNPNCPNYRGICCCIIS